MNIAVRAGNADIRKYLNDPLYKNSFFIILNKVLVVATGLAFWLLAARLYSMENVGLAVALISASTLIISFSTLGLDFSLIRYISSYDKSIVFNTCITVVIATSVLLGLGYILTIGIFSPHLSFIQDPVYGLVFLIFVVASAAALITSNMFISIRKAEYNFIQNAILTSRVPLLLPLFALGTFGIFGSMVISYSLLFIFAVYTLGKIIKFNFKVDGKFIRESFRFSSRNYVANIFSMMPLMVLPLLVLNVLGEADSAKYYIAFTIGNFFFQITDALSVSLLVEGSHGENLKKNAIKAIVAVYTLLIPAFLVIFLFGGYILNIFGKGYADAFDLLKLIALSSFFYAIYMIFLTSLNVKTKVNTMVVFAVLFSILLLGLSYVSIINFGITGVGYAMIATFAILIAAAIGLSMTSKGVRTTWE